MSKTRHLVSGVYTPHDWHTRGKTQA